ncbi:MAG TPA: histidine phosphatase family protein [Sphingomonadaceae bacterium]|jgi:broad specificity phosphatase PhoE|nr:histidine phosphatase family protein [Sphingomonadaceae bacterium]
MSTPILLARHAAHAEIGRILSGRHTGVPLNEEGRRQAERLAHMLEGRGIVAIQCSPQRRARETAEIIAARLARDIEIVDALDEVDFGGWSGRRFDELEQDSAWRRWNAERASAATPGGETMAQAVARVVAHLEQLAAARRGTVLCVSHCDIIRGTLAHYLGLGFDNLLRFDIDPASLSALAVGEWGGRVTLLNAVAA